MVSGDKSVLSGNNVKCQGQGMKDIIEESGKCDSGISSPSDTANFKIITIQRANCHSHSCPYIE